VLTAGQFRQVAGSGEAAGALPAALAPGRELPLQLNFRIDGKRVAGYSIELFYP
jgi:hypothetical protein